MNINKHSFVLYNEIIDTIDELSDDEAGKIFKMILLKVNNRDFECKDKLLRLVFKPIEKSIERNNKKYENKIKEKSNSGQIGNLKRWNKDLYEDFQKGKIDLDEALTIAKSRKTLKSEKPIANVADNENDNVPQIDSLNDTECADVSEDEILDLYTVGNKFLKDKEVVIAFIESHKLKNKNHLVEKMKAFHLQLKKDKKTKKTLKDYSRHLDSWLNKQKDKKPNNYENVVGGASAADVDRQYGIKR